MLADISLAVIPPASRQKQDGLRAGLSSPAEKDFGVLKVKPCHQQQVKVGDCVPLLHESPPAVLLDIQLWVPQHQRDVDLLEQAQGRP